MQTTTYKQTRIGLIPTDWEVRKLGDVAKIKHGKDQKKVEVIDGKYPILGTGGEMGKTNTFLYDKPSVLIGRKGTIDKPRFMDTPFWTVDTLFYTELSDNIVPKWLFNVFQTIDWYFYNEASGVPSLSGSTISAILLPIPPLPEQQKIATILSTWDAAIDKYKSIIDNVKQRNKGLAQQLLNSEKWKDKSEKWNTIKLGSVFAESKIPSQNNSNPDMRITVRLNLKGIEKREFRGTESEDATYFYTRKAGQFIYGKQNLHKGAFGLIPNELNGFESSSDIPAFDFKEGFFPKFIMHFFSQKSFYEKLEDISTGTGSKRIQPRELYKVEIKIPSLQIQKRIANILDTATAELVQYEQKLQTLQQQKKGLMQQLLTGKTRVKI